MAGSSGVRKVARTRDSSPERSEGSSPLNDRSWEATVIQSRAPRGEGSLLRTAALV
jgi:hypothetical protein